MSVLHNIRILLVKNSKNQYATGISESILQKFIFHITYCTQPHLIQTPANSNWNFWSFYLTISHTITEENEKQTIFHIQLLVHLGHRFISDFQDLN